MINETGAARANAHLRSEDGRLAGNLACRNVDSRRPLQGTDDGSAGDGR
jgi:hypothetical protein